MLSEVWDNPAVILWLFTSLPLFGLKNMPFKGSRGLCVLGGI